MVDDDAVVRKVLNEYLALVEKEASTGAKINDAQEELMDKVVAKYGKLTGCCCFCNRPLTDARSTEVGYGEICSKKFGVRYPLRSELRNVQELVAA